MQVSLLVATLKATWGIEDWTMPPSPTPMPRRRASKGEVGTPDSLGQVRGPRYSMAGIRHQLQPGSSAGFRPQSSSVGPRASLDSLADMQVGARVWHSHRHPDVATHTHSHMQTHGRVQLHTHYDGHLPSHSESYAQQY